MRPEKFLAENQRLWADRLRWQGYADGYTLKPAASLEADYQAGWRAGRADRRKEDEQ